MRWSLIAGREEGSRSPNHAFFPRSILCMCILPSCRTAPRCVLRPCDTRAMAAKNSLLNLTIPRNWHPHQPGAVSRSGTTNIGQEVKLLGGIVELTYNGFTVKPHHTTATVVSGVCERRLPHVSKTPATQDDTDDLVTRFESSLGKALWIALCR